MKEFIELLKKGWSNKRYRSSIILGLWLLGFFILGLAFRGGNTPKPNVESNSSTKTVESKVTDSLNLNSYEYLYTITSNLGQYEISGTYYNNQELINYNSNKYYYYNNLYLIQNDNLVKTDEINLKILNIKINTIYKLINNLKEDYLTKYTDGNFKTSYQVKLSDIGLYYNKLNINSNELIDIVLSGTNNKINKIEVNLDKLSSYINPKLNKYRLTIDLSNMNNITNFENKYMDKIKE